MELPEINDTGGKKNGEQEAASVSQVFKVYY